MNTEYEKLEKVQDLHQPAWYNPSRQVGFFGASFIRVGEWHYVRAFIYEHLNILYKQGCRDFYIGMDRGFSLLVLSELGYFRKKYPNCAVTLLEPKNMEALLHEWSQVDAEAYMTLRQRVTHILHTAACSADVKPSPVHLELLRRCGRLVYFPGFAEGNTALTVRLAKEQGLPIERLASWLG